MSFYHKADPGALKGKHNKLFLVSKLKAIVLTDETGRVDTLRWKPVKEKTLLSRPMTSQEAIDFGTKHQDRIIDYLLREVPKSTSERMPFEVFDDDYEHVRDPHIKEFMSKTDADDEIDKENWEDDSEDDGKNGEDDEDDDEDV